MAYTHSNNHQWFANERRVAGSDGSDEDQVRNPKLDLLETDKNGQIEDENESFYTGSSQKRNKHDEVDNGQESDSPSSATILKNSVHVQNKKVSTGFQKSPSVRRIMLQKARAKATRCFWPPES